MGQEDMPIKPKNIVWDDEPTDIIWDKLQKDQSILSMITDKLFADKGLTDKLTKPFWETNLPALHVDPMHKGLSIIGDIAMRLFEQTQLLATAGAGKIAGKGGFKELYAKDTMPADLLGIQNGLARFGVNVVLDPINIPMLKIARIGLKSLKLAKGVKTEKVAVKLIKDLKEVPKKAPSVQGKFKETKEVKEVIKDLQSGEKTLWHNTSEGKQIIKEGFEIPKEGKVEDIRGVYAADKEIMDLMYKHAKEFGEDFLEIEFKTKNPFVFDLRKGKSITKAEIDPINYFEGSPAKIENWLKEKGYDSLISIDSKTGIIEEAVALNKKIVNVVGKRKLGETVTIKIAKGKEVPSKKTEGIKEITDNLIQKTAKKGSEADEHIISFVKKSDESEIGKILSHLKTEQKTMISNKSKDFQGIANRGFLTDLIKQASGKATAPEYVAKATGKKFVEKSDLIVRKKFIQALKEAKPLRGKQEQIYRTERGKKLGEYLKTGERVSGEKGFYIQKSKLKGEMTKVEFESLRDKIKQTDMDNLFDQIKYSPEISEWEKVPAGTGLSKIFGELGGVVPTNNEIGLLEKVFGKELTRELIKKQSMFTRFKDIALNIANIPRSLMTSFDLSFGFRQGVFVVARHPKIFFQNFGKQFKLFANEKYYQQMVKEIHGRPNFELMQKSGLSFTELGKSLAKREEAFMSSFAEKIPVAGAIVRASGRAYTGFANRLRADLFDYMVDYGKKIKKSGDNNYLKSAAKYINAATGRGSLGRLEKVAVELNTVFFSPRLLASRIQLMNPVFYAKLDPIVRREALKSLLSFGGMALTVSGIAKMSGAEIETDPRNANFMKIKVGNTRYDPLGGFQQPIRAAAQIISGKIISSTTGKEMTLGEGYKPLTRLDIATRFIEMKEAPLVSFATSLMRGTTSIGEKIDVPTEIANRFIPMVIQDMNDLYREKGSKGIPMAVPAIFGTGVQTYGGVQTWGLKGTDYPILNKELLRLKTTMGFPSTSVFGREFSNAEYKDFKKVAGNTIAKELTKLIKTDKYRNSKDFQKKKEIWRYIDINKNELKTKLYLGDKIKSDIRSSLRQEGVKEDKLEESVNLIRRKQ
jgi:hypothetical protein